MNAQHTPGPWRWEFNAEHKTVDLVGGRPMFDLTVMDFARWGMGHAVPRFRDTSEDGMNLMDRLCDKPEWIAPEPGREHHKKWHQLVTHPDARLMAAAPELLEALHRIVSTVPAQDGVGGLIIDHHDMDGEYLGTQQIDPLLVIQEMAAVAQDAIAKATGGEV